jgi:hypothetical protein
MLLDSFRLERLSGALASVLKTLSLQKMPLRHIFYAVRLNYAILLRRCHSHGLLTTLDLQDNGLEGTLPPQISVLSNLRIFNLQDNRLDGNIPHELSSLVCYRPEHSTAGSFGA